MSGKRTLLVLGVSMVIFSASLSAAEKTAADVIDAAITDLVGGNSREQMQAAQVLAGQEPKDIAAHDIVELLVEKIKKDENRRLQVVVVRALGTIADSAEGATKNDIIKALTDTLNNSSTSARVRGQAVYVLGDTVDPNNYEGRNIKKTLTKLARDKKTPTSLSRACYDVLARWGVLEIAKEIEAQIKKGDRNAIAIYKRLVIKGRGTVKISGTAASAFLRMVEDERRDTAFRIDLLELLAIAIKNESKITGLGDTIEKIIKRSSNDRVRLAAVEAVGRTLDADLIKILIKVYEDNKDKKEAGAVQLRRAACAAAGEYFYPFSKKASFPRYRSALKKLSEMLVNAIMNDESGAVCRDAAYGLGNMYSKKYDRRRPVAALIETLADQDAAVSEAALDSLKNITEEDFETDLKAWRDWYKKNERSLGPR